MEPKKKIIIVRIFWGILLTGFIFLIVDYFFSDKESAAIKEVCFNNSCFSVELSQTQEERSFGLMGRESLDQNRGMLFIFAQEGNYGFWMKDTLIPLDIIWINSANYAVYIARDVQPCKADFCPTITPEESAKYVLEVNAGVSDNIGLQVGDKLTLK